MIKKVLNLAFLMLIGISGVVAQNQTVKFGVNGKCDMCKSRIEKAALSVEGVSNANWDKESKIAEITFDSSKTDMHKIQFAIAEAGHDTDMHIAKDENYNKLPSCCRYTRTVGNQNAAESTPGNSGCTRHKKVSGASCCNK
ncbi:heavy-metal-associated domain-containing protein [Ancylomarina longa]|uniref:ATPase n=1 Tax=Ancylomarina longa TaxID=2487017 RepID=A0A434AYR1_9BACT|nr:heavy-metal-associated domain-containing protein [Ancylomarina longa]RUT79722.1 ATPase [Ancylomarina longa]